VGWDEDQCWTLARIAEVIRRRFKADYTLAGVDLLLHRIGWSVRVPARQATERDEAAITRWKQVSWPQIKDGGGHGRLLLLAGGACCPARGRGPVLEPTGACHADSSRGEAPR